MKQLFALLLLFIFHSSQAQLKSPEQFLGYKIGTRFTPYHRIVDYVKTVAAASPNTVKLQQYGTTNEGRPLLALFISAPQNIANLESIRTKNLELTNAANGSGGASNRAIVWLSYNVHGNETSSSEAAMLTLYALVDPANAQTKEYLQNTVVIMDPCLNPDGRDRYVNWFNSIAGKNINPLPESREHREPWPGGRSNHYNFDLNRDWAWQTQVETQQRIALYNQWLPQVHVDFHEQGYNEPYYFAPAAEPFHEVITPWQREFQGTIGRNHAKYFDEAGWLYFTKERFDLLYPSYGDTYPIYNGAIGMTYEQGGGPSGGLGVITENGDTLTLVDRAQHHFTTGISTVEAASKNAARLVGEFQKYYRDASNGLGEYKAYILKMGAADTARMYALIELLNKNGIRYFSGRGSNLRGLNYNTLKEEAFTLSTSDLVIPSTQPKGALVKVLFEQNTKLADSATYDITAWSLPYAYGLSAYATKNPVTGLESYVVRKNVNTEMSGSPYAYVMPWTGINAAKLTGQLLQKGIKLRFVTQPFTASGQTFNRGSVLIMRTGNQQLANLWSTVRSAANEAGVKLMAVSSGFVDKGLDFGSSTVVPLKARKVAMFTGEGVGSLAAGEVWYYFEQVLNYPVTLINAADASRITWSDYDVVIMPDGGYRFLSDKTSADALKAWVSSGGNLIAMEGAMSGLSRLDWAVKAKKSEDSNSKDPYQNLRRYDDRERDALKDYTPGSIYKVELDNTHPLAFGYPGHYHSLKLDNNQFEFLKDGGWNVGVVKKDGPVAGFVGTTLNSRLRNHLVFGVQEIGRGTITYLADDVLFRSFWENGKLLFANAVFLVGQ
jgi:hypothetical protein